MNPRDVAVAIPSITPRYRLLDRALKSVRAQESPAAYTEIAYDGGPKLGAGPTRNRAMALALRLDPTWIAFLDDDDEMKPEHLRVLLDAAEETGADVVFPWFTVVGGTDPFPQHRGRQFDIEDPHIFPIACLVRSEVIRDSKAQFPKPGGEGSWLEDDLPFWRAIWEAGGKFHHVPDRTWLWHHHGSNTSGCPDRW